MAEFKPDKLEQELRAGPAAKRYLVGYSGGADSSALLDALSSISAILDAEIEAIHFHHGLHENADEWLRHCAFRCENLGIPFRKVVLDLTGCSKRSIEEEARDSRYAELARVMEPGDVYLTAHHGDDQAETLLLNLFRGAGLRGMAGIPRQRRLGAGWVLRPLLNFGRLDLERYLGQRGLDWCHDPSNQDNRFDRNFLRHEILPSIEQRWPKASGRLARAAGHARDSIELMDQLIDQNTGDQLDNPVLFPLALIKAESKPNASLLLRHWLRNSGTPALPEARLDELFRQLEASDRAEVSWSGHTLRSYRDHLWLQTTTHLPAVPSLEWGSESLLNLGAGLGSIECTLDSRNELSVRCRHEGDRLKLADQAPSRTAKQLFQHFGVPPWLRTSVPIVCHGKQIVAIGDWALESRFRELLNKSKAQLAWRPDLPGLKQLQINAHQMVVDP